MKFKKIFILGAGAIGSVVGALLSKKADVTLLGNRAHIEAVNSRGLLISGDAGGNFRVRADTQIRDVPQRTLIFLTTKAQDTERAMREVGRLLRTDTVVLVLQNGIGNEDAVKSAVGGRAEVLRGITTMAAEFFEAGQVRYWSGETKIEHKVAAEDVVQIMNSCGLKAKVSGNILDDVWAKAVVNSVVNPLTAIFRVRNNEIGQTALATVRHEIVRECVGVGRAEGASFPRGLAGAVDREILGHTNFSSMYQDIVKGKKTEIDFLNGKIVKLGEAHGVPTPVNETLVQFIRFLEERNELSRQSQTEKG